jgi:nucleoside-diphosphate-sugar epimerase
MTSIIDGTNHILNFAKIKNTRRILFISSGAVYGKYTIPISETFIC